MKAHTVHRWRRREEGKQGREGGKGGHEGRKAKGVRKGVQECRERKGKREKKRDKKRMKFKCFDKTGYYGERFYFVMKNLQKTYSYNVRSYYSFYIYIFSPYLSLLPYCSIFL